MKNSIKAVSLLGVIALMCIPLALPVSAQIDLPDVCQEENCEDILGLGSIVEVSEKCEIINEKLGVVNIKVTAYSYYKQYQYSTIISKLSILSKSKEKEGVNTDELTKFIDGDFIDDAQPEIDVPFPNEEYAFIFRANACDEDFDRFSEEVTNYIGEVNRLDDTYKKIDELLQEDLVPILETL